MAAAPAGNADLFDDRFEDGAVVDLARGDDQAERASSAFTGQVNLGGQAAAGAAESFVGTVSGRRRPFFAPFFGAAFRAPAAC